MSGDASSLTIRELSGERRSIVLSGRGLPFRPFELGKEQRVELTWLPGIGEATATVMGPKQPPLQMQGKWADKYLTDANFDPMRTDYPIMLNGVLVATVDEACKLFDSLTESGQMVELTWFTQRRTGIISKFTPRWHTVHDVEWSLNIEVIGTGDPLGVPVFAAVTSIGDVGKQLKNGLAGITSLSLNLPLDLGVGRAIADFTNGIQDLILDVENTLQSFTNGILRPVFAIRGLISTIRSIEDECNLMRDFMIGRVTQAFSAIDPADQTATDAIEAEAFRREFLAETAALRAQAIAYRNSLAKDIGQTDLAALYYARQGDTLQSISTTYYGSPFEWRRILLYNDLDSTELKPGMMILVPKINPQNSQEA